MNADPLKPAAREVELRTEIGRLQERLRESEETLDAIRSGDVDAVVIGGPDGAPMVYTLETVDQSYRVLVEQMEEGALTLRRDGLVLYCNRRLAAFLGVDASKIVGDLLQGFIEDSERAAFSRLLAAGGGKGEFLVQVGGGKTAPAYFSFAALSGAARDDEDTLCCIVTDLTEQRRTNEALRVAHRRLLAEVEEREKTEDLLRHSQKMEAVGQLTGGVAHDFNNLLMVISGGLDMLDRPSNPARHQRLRDGMRQAVQRGAGLTRQLLAFSRRQALNPEPIDVARQVEAMRELLDRSLRGDIHVRTEFAGDLWPVLADAGEFELVILNLCVNARDAMANAGAITIGAYNRPGMHDGELTGDFVCVTVTDSGSGMTPDVIARAFEPFFTTKDVGKGSGLGLAQAYGFALESGGRVDIESEPGHGTTIAILLPRSNRAPILEEARAVHSLPATSPSAGSMGSVLLVEDDDQVAALTREMLSDLGYDVTRAASAQAALGALANGRAIDLVFSDVMMPGDMSGIDLARELRCRQPDLPVVLTSGFAETARNAAAALNVLLLPKPYRIDELASTLLAAAGGRPAQSGAQTG